MTKYTDYEAINKKADDLSAQLNVKVHAFVAIDGTEDNKLVAFIREPNRLIKSRAMDKTYNGMGFTAGSEMFEACVVREETDPRFLSEAPENDKFYMGASKFCGDLLILATNNTKKN
ncbi:hypothetical protein J3L18_30985 [Mucilaginibacter gossypii]|uniref:hypothetical protein n=1 Tax=Mucilaginibacter gossypii TaxID=551996 RepID=UPI000DCEAFB2|nr:MULTISPECIES: hypothetical protein [Mucilaginibacter]QTE37473.1 hypothetical protein J3L18_30985 [Mucilaginibacter gossypii]RAV52299.1 hypothetical protein DIU36_24500 [Mucilaginibacter rubeus]